MMDRMSNPVQDEASSAHDAIPKNYQSAVLVLAAAHAAGMERVEIYSLPDPDEAVVRLIEVSDAFPEGGVDRPIPPDGMERVVPVFPMGRAKDFPFRSEIAQITPAEWDQLRNGKLKLNRNWGNLKQAQKIEHGH